MIRLRLFPLFLGLLLTGMLPMQAAEQSDAVAAQPGIVRAAVVKAMQEHRYETARDALVGAGVGGGIGFWWGVAAYLMPCKYAMVLSLSNFRKLSGAGAAIGSVTWMLANAMDREYARRFAMDQEYARRFELAAVSLPALDEEKDLLDKKSPLSPAYQALADEALVRIESYLCTRFGAVRCVQIANAPLVGSHVLGCYRSTTSTVYLDEEKLNAYSYGVRRIVMLHELVHHWQACYKWAFSEHQADKVSLELSRCYCCVREHCEQVAHSSGTDRYRSQKGYYSEDEYKPVEDRHRNAGEVCVYHRAQALDAARSVMPFGL